MLCRKRRYLRECAINFWVECGSAGSYQGNDGVDTTRGRWWWRVGGDKREGEHKRQYGRVELFVGRWSQQLVSVQATPVYVGFHDGGFYIKYIKRDERFNWIRIRFD
jgi:hypothetical protein